MDIYTDISRLINTYGSSRAPTHEENQGHFKRLITCQDDTELNAYAVANIRMVASVVTKFIKRHRRAVYLVDDLFSTSLCTMFIALRSLVKRAKRDPEEFWSDIGKIDDEGKFPVFMYLYISMYRKVQLCYEKDAVESISASMAERFTPEGSQKPLHKVNVPGEVIEGTLDDPFSVVYLMEDILECCKTDFECDVVRMRLVMDDPEIAVFLGKTRSQVQRARTKINHRYQQSLQKEFL